MTRVILMRWLALVLGGLCVVALGPGATGYAAASRGQLRHDRAVAVQAGPASPAAIPAPPAAIGYLTGIACVSAADCLAVGVTRGGSVNVGTQFLAEHWNGRTWTPAGSPMLRALPSVTCPQARLCQAVGGGIAERWNGRAWIREKTPAVPEAFLNGVSCSTATACVAVGSTATGPLAETWNGSAWTVRNPVSPAGASQVSLSWVSCTGTAACIAVGSYVDPADDQVTLAESWNGRTWTVLTTPPTTGTFAALTGVSCASSTSCVAVGYGNFGALAESWNGVTWTVMPVPPDYPTAVSCAAPTSCMAIAGSAMSWNGSSWTALPMPPSATATTLTAVSCPAAASCMAVGGDANIGSFAMSWDGSAWRGLRVNRTDEMSGVSCTRADLCMATGSFVTASGRLVALTESWNGSSWRRPPASQAADGVLSDVSCVSAARCVAVGALGQSATLAEAWNGTAWRVTPPPGQGGQFPTGLDAVSCRGVTCLAVGFFSWDAWLWNGAAWRTIQVPAPSRNGGALSDVSCASRAYCMAAGFFDAGDEGDPHSVSLAELWNGKHWRWLKAPGTGLNTVSCTSAHFCMVAAGNTAEIWNGTGWRARKLPGSFGTGSPGITAISCIRRSACMAVGNYLARVGSRLVGFNVAEFWNGTRWRRLPTTGPGGGLTDVSCTSASRCMAVGLSAADPAGTRLLAERWNGRRWRRLAALNP